MATVTTNIQFQTNDNTWFSANASLVLLDGESAYHVDGRYKFGDGVTVLSALSFLGAGGGGGSQDLQSVTDLGSVTTNNVEANSFVKTGGVSTEFLKGDGTVDTNTYLTTESQTLQNVTDLGNTTTNDIQFDTGVGVLLDNTSRLREGTIDAGYGGAKGIAQICAVGYELKWESGTLYVMDGNGTHIRHSLYNFASVPGASEDISKGFLVGTRWSLDNGNLYVCTNNSIGAAVWVLEASDFTSTEKTKLSGIASGAEVNVNADWNAISGDAEILNKPTIPSIAGLELQANKQNSLTVDGTGVKYPTVDAINSAITNINTNAVDLITVKLALPINKGQAVYISSANGTNIIVSKASNTSESTSSKTLGLLETTGTTNDIVNVVTDGLLGGLNTSAATIGDAVWLGVTGALIFGLASKPYAPAHLVYIGVVSRVHATVGEIIVKVQNGFELKEIHDVDLITTAPSNNEILTYESSTSLWKNKTVTTALGYTPENTTNKSSSYTASSTTTYANTKALVDGLATKGSTNLDNLVFSGSYMPHSLGCTTSATTAGINGYMISQKISGRKTCTITSLSAYCNTGVAGGNIRIAIYSDLNGLPNTLIAGTDTGNISCATTGLKEGAITPYTLVSGTVYHVVIQASSGTISLRYNLNQEKAYWSPSVSNNVFSILASSTYIAFPATFPTITFYYDNATFNTCIYLKAQ